MDEQVNSQYGKDMSQFSGSHLNEKDQLSILKDELTAVKIREMRNRHYLKKLTRHIYIQSGILFILFMSIFIMLGLGYVIL